MGEKGGSFSAPAKWHYMCCVVCSEQTFSLLIFRSKRLADFLMFDCKVGRRLNYGFLASFGKWVKKVDHLVHRQNGITCVCDVCSDQMFS